MDKKLIIIGNGLGMALNPDHFSLAKAMERVWNCPTKLSLEEKATIGSLKGFDADTGPQSEDDLISTQLALGFLTAFQKRLGQAARDTWLTPDARKYPHTLRKYIFEVAHELYDYKIPQARQDDWNAFIQSLLTFVAQTGSHIATLNYDDLLYEEVMTKQIQIGATVTTLSGKKSGQSPYIRDGFLAEGKYTPQSFDYCCISAFYLHLHGTPLFTTKDSTAIKLNRNNIAFTPDTERRHIVLAHANDKERLIKQSEILCDYWESQLPKCIRQAGEVILFGYSGEDAHFNSLIAEKHNGNIRVVEWSGAGDEDDRRQHWQDCFASNEEKNALVEGKTDLSIIVDRRQDILEFRDWQEHDPFPF